MRLRRAKRVRPASVAGRPVLRVTGDLLLDICTGLAGVEYKALATDQTPFNASRDRPFEQMAEMITLAEPTTRRFAPAVARRFREGRVFRDAVRQVETAETAVGEVQMHLFAEPPL